MRPCTSLPSCYPCLACLALPCPALSSPRQDMAGLWEQYNEEYAALENAVMQIRMACEQKKQGVKRRIAALAQVRRGWGWGRDRVSQQGGSGGRSVVVVHTDNHRSDTGRTLGGERGHGLNRGTSHGMPVPYLDRARTKEYGMPQQRWRRNATIHRIHSPWSQWAVALPLSSKHGPLPDAGPNVQPHLPALPPTARRTRLRWLRPASAPRRSRAAPSRCRSWPSCCSPYCEAWGV